MCSDFLYCMLVTCYIISSQSQYQYLCLPTFARCSFAPYKIFVSLPRFTGPRRLINTLFISWFHLFFYLSVTLPPPPPLQSTQLNPPPSQTQTKPGGGAKRSSGGTTGLAGVGGVIGGLGGSGGGDSPDAGQPTLDPATGILSTPGQLKPPQQQQPQAPVSQRFMHVHACAHFYLSLTTLMPNY